MKVSHGVPILSKEKLGLEDVDLGPDPLEGLARYGTKLVLTSYLAAEVEELINAGHYERKEERKGYRNGFRGRHVECGVGRIEIPYPKVRGTGRPFQSEILDAWQRKSASVLALLPQLYIEGLSTRDFKRGMAPLWKNAGLSRSTISRANEQLKREFGEWRKRDLSKENILFLYLDAYYLGVRREGSEDAILAAHGLSESGERIFLGIWMGGSESKDSWAEALNDLVGRGFRCPLLVISDGNPGLISAVKSVWPKVPRQRCIVHRIHNILARIPKELRPRFKKELNRIFYATSEEEARKEAERFVREYKETYTAACEVLVTDLADCLNFFRFPERYWKRIRTSNLIERQFREVRRRTKVIGRFPNEISALSLSWAVMCKGEMKFNGIAVSEERLSKIREGHASLLQNPIQTRDLERLLAA